MKLVILFGPPAVGKMTVGQQLANLTGFKLFHNHMTIELALNFFALTRRSSRISIRCSEARYSVPSQRVSFRG
jgi:shikimate kinase